MTKKMLWPGCIPVVWDAKCFVFAMLRSMG